MVTENEQETTPIGWGPYTALAQSLIEQLHAFRDQIPRFAFRPSKFASKRTITLASVPIEFERNPFHAETRSPRKRDRGEKQRDRTLSPCLRASL